MPLRRLAVAAVIVTALAVGIGWLGWTSGSFALCWYYFAVPLAVVAAGWVVRVYVVPLAVLFYAVLNLAYVTASLAGHLSRGGTPADWLGDQVWAVPWLAFLLGYTVGCAYMIHRTIKDRGHP